MVSTIASCTPNKLRAVKHAANPLPPPQITLYPLPHAWNSFEFQFYFRSYEPFISAFCTYIVSNIVSCAPNKLRAVKHAVDGKSPCRPIWTPKTTLITLTYRTTNSSNYHSEHRSLKVSLWIFPECIVCLSIAQPHKKEVRSTTV